MKFMFILFIGLFLVACGTSSQQTSAQNGHIKYATNFQIIEKDSYQLLQLYHPKSHKIEASFALVRRGEHPTVPENTPTISVPVRNMAALSSTFIGMLNELHSLDCVKMTTSENYLWNKSIKKRIKKGTCIAVSSDEAISPELVVKNKLELIVFSGFGQPFPNESKLAQLGVVSLPNYDWEETTALGKLEWIKLFGVLTGKLQEATTYFTLVESKYKALKKQAASNKSTNSRTIVGDFYGDNWFAPAGDSYIARMLKDAGINYIYHNEKGTASLQLSPEQVMKDERSCTVWINAEGTSLGELIKNDQKRKQLTVLKKQQVYSYLHDSNYYWEMSAVHPEWLLSDFCQIAQNKQTNPLFFYKKLKE